MNEKPSRFADLVRRAPLSDAAADTPAEVPAPADTSADAPAAIRPAGRRRDPLYRPVTLYLPAALHDAALDAARRHKRAGTGGGLDTVSGVAEAALRAYLDAHPAP